MNSKRWQILWRILQNLKMWCICDLFVSFDQSRQIFPIYLLCSWSRVLLWAEGTTCQFSCAVYCFLYLTSVHFVQPSHVSVSCAKNVLNSWFLELNISVPLLTIPKAICTPYHRRPFCLFVCADLNVMAEIAVWQFETSLTVI